MKEEAGCSLSLLLHPHSIVLFFIVIRYGEILREGEFSRVDSGVKISVKYRGECEA